ncbi:hypothetical protein M8C21_004975 [Ambrosia artemisiifolia]|uniref:Splicing factor 3B subunit 1-like protein n=1 Tax=Ambrosia artemisiifolia TaxID=4212 RepID=A0AAD5GH53_AMBAR|nr:hypothetical protein M8C21_004975 [Ambrosia artemisiifolia]
MNICEEYPEVLGSILGALKAIMNVIGMSKMTPPIKDLLPRLTSILKNRHEKVQENYIDLVGHIVDRGAEFVPACEWMRICFELLGMLKAHKKGIRQAAVNTFCYIAKAIGPQDVLATLLNNLKSKKDKTYIGEMGKHYIYAVTPLLEDALMDWDLVHRQTAASAVKHIALGVAGLGCEDALIHLLNYVWPNIFEISPHVINAVMEAIEGMRVALVSEKSLKKIQYFSLLRRQVRLMKKKDVAKVIFEVKKDLHQHDELHSEHSLKIPHGRWLDSLPNPSDPFMQCACYSLKIY